jgi:5-oxoprolinase (ATP-hydrolysing) subunit B
VLDCGTEAAAVASAVHAHAERIGVTLSEVVPGAATVLVVAANPVDLQRFLGSVGDLTWESTPAGSAPLVEIATRYDGPDLRDVAAATGLEVVEVVRRHSAVTYQAAFTGFAPGFAYLRGLDPILRLPRRGSPRPAVPAGSVAIADLFSAVYPRATPGGWHLLGSTDEFVFDPAREPAALIAPGTQVRFTPLPGPLP